MQPANAVIAMCVFRPLIAASLVLASQIALAQAGDQPFEDVDVIALPSQAPEKPAFSLNWSCEAITLSSSQRYRPNNCVERGRNGSTQARELEVETIGLEQASDTPGPQRKGR